MSCTKIQTIYTKKKRVSVTTQVYFILRIFLIKGRRYIVNNVMLIHYIM